MKLALALLALNLIPLNSCASSSSTPSLSKLSFQQSWHAGEKDANGNLMAGTELMHLVPYKGKLYAANSLWMENDASVHKACQIFVLDSRDGKWRLEHEFTENNLRLVSLKAVTFTTDAKGKAIKPVSLLLAAPDVYMGDVQIYSLDDGTGEWVPMSLGEVLTYTTTRAIGFHRDSVTGIDLVFAGTDTLSTIAGVYDPSVPGRIRWLKSPEFKTPTGDRVMSFANCNGVLYCSTSRHIFKRTDGTSPSWQEVYFCPQETSPAGIRGLTAVPSPSGKGEVLLFAALNMVRHIDPADNYRETVELDMPSFLTDLWKIPVAGVLCAYNEFMPYTIPGTGETVWLFGFESSYPAYAVQQNPQLRLFIRQDLKWYFAAEGRYFIRHATNNKISYELGEITSPGLPILVAVRTITMSPFSADQGQVLYFAGFDCNSQPSHNTAWIYRGTLKNE